MDREVIAALLNAQSVNYPLLPSTILYRYQVAVGAIPCLASMQCDTPSSLLAELSTDDSRGGSLCSGLGVVTLGCPANCGRTGVAYSSAFTVSGGTPGYTFSITSGSLPPGLVLNPTTGAITGTPTNSGTYAFTASVYDSICATGIHADTENCCITITSLPSPWNKCDVGSVGACGDGRCSGSTYTVCGSGADIWNCADEFHYVYQTGSGDCSVVARVSSCQNTDPWAKAGVMIRESLNAGARQASLFITPGNGLAFQCRTSTGGTSINSNTTGYSAPYWLKITRSGSTFTAYRSANGSTWTAFGSQSITMGSNVYIGLAVCSHDDGTVCTSTFDNVTATP